MKNNFNIRGIITALVTPFKNGKLNLFDFEKLIKSQMQANIDALLLFGTTGEPLSLSETEKKILFFTAKEISSNRLPIITGISSPITKDAVKSAVKFIKYKSDGLLVITPYYYKFTSDGIVKHFTQINNATNLPIIAYNVPPRTNYDLMLHPNALDAICSLENVCAIKLAESNQSKLIQTIKSLSIPTFCGCDEHNLVAYKNGAIGSISVISNAFPKICKDIYECVKADDLKQAKSLNDKLQNLVSYLATQPNPTSIKCLLHKTLNLTNELRLPLTTASVEAENKISAFLKEF